MTCGTMEEEKMTVVEEICNSKEEGTMVTGMVVFYNSIQMQVLVMVEVEICNNMKVVETY